MHMSRLNAVIILVKYQTRSCSPDILSKFLEAIGHTLNQKLLIKQRGYPYQKCPQIIEAICKLCVLFKQSFTTCKLSAPRRLRRLAASAAEGN